MNFFEPAVKLESRIGLKLENVLIEKVVGERNLSVPLVVLPDLRQHQHEHSPVALMAPTLYNRLKSYYTKEEPTAPTINTPFAVLLLVRE